MSLCFFVRVSSCFFVAGVFGVLGQAEFKDAFSMALYKRSKRGWDVNVNYNIHNNLNLDC
jgi:hypothetical protein